MNLVLFLQAATATVFFVAAAGKLVRRVHVTGFLTAAGIDTRAARAIDRIIIPIEGAVAFLLYTNTLGMIGLMTAFVVSASFVAVQARALRRGVGGGCRCFGFGTEAAGTVGLVRASTLATGLLALLILTLREDSAGSLVLPLDAPRMNGVLSAVAILVAFALADEVASFRTHRRDLIGRSLLIDPEAPASRAGAVARGISS